MPSLPGGALISTIFSILSNSLSKDSSSQEIASAAFSGTVDRAKLCCWTLLLYGEAGGVLLFSFSLSERLSPLALSSELIFSEELSKLILLHCVPAVSTVERFFWYS